jgi:HEAT repeat protein
MRSTRLPAAVVALLALAAPLTAATEDDVKLLQEAGLRTDGASLLDFFRTRARVEPDRGRLAALVRDLGDPAAEVHSKAAAELIAWGPFAVPWLRKGVNDLESPAVSRQARRCLHWIEGQPGSSLTAAAVRLLAERRPDGAADALLAYLPFADDPLVTEAAGAGLTALAFAQGKADAALLKGLADPVPVRRAVAGEALCRADQPEQLPNVRKLLQDPKPAVRLRAALALAKQHDAEAVPVLIELIPDLDPEQRKQVEELLQGLAGEWSPGSGSPGTDDISRRIRRDVWAAWWRNTDGPALLAEFRKRVLTPEGEAKVRELVKKLGDETFSVREVASDDVVLMGRLAVPMLREATRDADAEIARRATACLERIEKGEGNPLPGAAPRLLALRKPAGAAEVLLAYLPFAEDDTMAGEVRVALGAVAVRDGKPEPAVLEALADRLPLRRAAAAEALCRAGQPAAARKALADADPAVRLRAAVALATAREKDAVPVLIDLVGDLPREQSWEAMEVLTQLAGERAPTADAGDDAAGRKKARDAWAAWWKDNAAKADLSRLASESAQLGYTLLVLVEGSGMGRVTELGRDGKPRWEIANLQYPVDAWVLPGNRVLVAEYNGRKVTERDLKGGVVWEKGNFSALVVNCQRLPNGNTFVVTQNQLVEVDRAGREVFTHNWPQGNIWSAYKTPNGQLHVLTGNEYIRLDAAGKELKRYNTGGGGSWTSGIHVTPRGNLVVPHHGTNRVVEFDADGKQVWQAAAPGVTTVTRLPNGHTLVASYGNQRVFELDAGGKTVWEHRSAFHPFRARRR